jgi:hypothetical protein
MKLPSMKLRRIASCILVVAVSLTHASGDDSGSRYQWFENDAGDKWGLEDTKTGKVIFPPRFTGGTGRRADERLGTDIRNGKAWVFEDSKIKLINVQGHILATVDGIMVRQWHDNLVEIETKAGYGLYSDSEEAVLEPRYFQISDPSDGMAVIGFCGPGTPTPTTPPHYGYIDDKGSVVIPPTFLRADPFSEDVAFVSDKDGYRFIDKSGLKAFTPAASLVFPFSDGLAAAYTQETGWGFIDKTGKFVVPSKYEDVFFFFKDGRSWAGVPNDNRRIFSKGWVFIDDHGNELTPSIYLKPPSGIDPEMADGKNYPFGNLQPDELETAGLFRTWSKTDSIVPLVGLITRDGKVVVPGKYTHIEDFVGGRAAVDKFDGKSTWTRGLIDLQGNEVLPMGNYDQIVPLADGTARVFKAGKSSVIDQSGKFESDFQ